MALKIIKQVEVPLLSRKEIEAELSFNGPVPSGNEVKKAVAKGLGCDESIVVIKQIMNKFSDNSAKVFAYQYMSEDDMKKIEPSSKKEADKSAKAPKEEAKAAAPTEAPKEEVKAAAPTEAPKEEKKAEEKPKEEVKKEVPKEEKKVEAKEEAPKGE
jgi:ribosomal protein S24E